MSIGDPVRHYTLEHGWMFGTITLIECAVGPTGVLHAWVEFPAHVDKSVPKRSYPSQTRKIALFLLEACS